MNVRFRSDQGLIIVRTTLVGPDGDTVIRMALDTAATRTLIVPAPLMIIGCDPTTSTRFRQAATVSGIERSRLVRVDSIESLGHRVSDLDVLCQTLPRSVGVDGLLGLDFVRGLNLNVDFRNGTISLT
jgi:hypothetical protein